MAESEQDIPSLLSSLYAEMYVRRRIGEQGLNYYDGAHKLAFASEKFLEAFGGLFGAFADNWCATVVDAVEERLHVNGFRVDPTASADAAAKQIWERNELDILAGMGHTDGLIQGSFNVTVWQAGDSADDSTEAEITIESQATSIVRTHPKKHTLRTSALRTWLDDDGFEHAELFLPDRVYLFRSKTKRTGPIVDPGRVHWIEDDNPDMADKLDSSSSMENPLGVVPMVAFVNRPRLTRSRRAGFNAHSEIAAVIPIQDATNKLVADMMIASEFAAYPQRHVTGWEADTDENDQIIPPKFEGGPGRTWWTESEGASFGAFPTVSIDQYVKAVAMMVQHIASISRTPQHYLNASADRLSGESLKSAETGLISKIFQKQTVLAAGWEEVMRLAGQVEGNQTIAGAEDMEIIWRDPETRTESEHVDAVVKKQAVEVPNEQLWTELGYTPEVIARFPAMRARSSIETAAAQAEIRNPAIPLIPVAPASPAGAALLEAEAETPVPNPAEV